MRRFMSQWIVFGTFCLYALPFLAHAQEPENSRRAELKEKIKKTFSSPTAPIKTMPANAIVVLDPGVDPRGEPRPVLRQTSTVDGKGFEVEIPETVHIHRYFPCGSREFQAQYFAGGPTVVVARHPYTNEQMYIDMVLPPGYPKMKYAEEMIEYKFTEESFGIHFEKCGSVTTSYCGCGIVKVRAKEAGEHVRAKTIEYTERLGINKVAERAVKDVREATDGTIDTAGQFITQSGDLIISAVNLVPGVQMLKSAGLDRATKERDKLIQRITSERAKLEEDVKRGQ